MGGRNQPLSLGLYPVLLVLVYLALRYVMQLPQYDSGTHSQHSTESRQWRHTPSRNADDSSSDDEGTVYALNMTEFLLKHYADIPSEQLQVPRLQSFSRPDGTASRQVGLQSPHNTPEYVIPSSYGVEIHELHTLVDYWRDVYRTHNSSTMRSLQQRDHYSTNINGLSIHFIQAAYTGERETCINLQTNRSAPVSNAAAVVTHPILLLHGWPGSVLEFLYYYSLAESTCYYDENTKIVHTLHIVAPSLPGFGFSDDAEVAGLDPLAISEVFLVLMRRLGFARFSVSGGDWGAIVAACMAQLDFNAHTQANEHVARLHLNFVTPASRWTPLYYLAASILPPSWVFGTQEDVNRARLPTSNTLWDVLDKTGYMHQQATRSDTVAVALSASPIALGAWILEKFTEWSDLSKHNSAIRKFSADWLISNIMLYWTCGPAPSLRLYKESLSSKRFVAAMMSKVSTPTCVADFPHEMMRVPRSLLQDRFPNLVDMTTFPSGGHFAALEEPELLAGHLIRCLLPLP